MSRIIRSRSDLEPHVQVRVGHIGSHWFAVGLLETPHGPVVLTATGNERAIHAALMRRLQLTQGAAVGFSFKKFARKLRKAVQKIAKSSVVQGVKNQLKKIAKNPIVATAIRLHTDALKLAKKALKSVTNNPLWDIAATGASFIPGVGQAVSAGMATAAALGRGASFKDAALAAVKNALPGGPLAAAAFDVALGVAHGDRIDAIALKTVRNQLPGGALGKAAFDAGLEAIKTKSLKGIPAMAAKAAIDQAGKGPLWDKLATGARLVPGLGAITSAGMAGAIAMGRRIGVENMALAAARSAIPHSALKAAFDAGVGIAQGKRLDAAALDIVRKQLPQTESALAAFNTGLAIARGKAGDLGAVRALQQSLPESVRAPFTRLAARAIQQRALGGSARKAFSAASTLLQRIRSGDEGAREHLRSIVARAQEGDAAARAAALMLKKALQSAPQVVASQTAVNSAAQAVAHPEMFPPATAPALPAASNASAYSASEHDYPEQDGTQALISSMDDNYSVSGESSPCGC